MPIKEADIPANIKWEDRQAENQVFGKRRCQGIFKIALIITITLNLVFVLRYFTTKYVSPYRRIDCPQMLGQFDVFLPEVFNTRFKKDADYFTSMSKQYSDSYSLNLASCYCTALMKNISDISSYLSNVQVPKQ